MATIDYNEILNAFIDVLPFDKIPDNFKNDASVSLTDRDGVCAAVKSMTLEWQTLWNRDAANFDKIQIIQKVENSQDLLIRQQEERSLINEPHICDLLSDMIPEYKDGTYFRILREREMFLVTKMMQFLDNIKIPIPPIMTEYISEYNNALH